MGTWLHELLMVHTDGEDWRERHAVLTKNFNNLWEEEREDLGDLPADCARIMLSYERHYKLDAQKFTTVDTELDEVVTLPNGVRLNIIIDAIVEDKVLGGLWIKDYKTRGKFAEGDDMLLDPQLTLYFKAAEMMGYTPLLGAMYDEIRTKPPAVPKTLVAGGLSKRKDIDTDVFTYMSEIRRLGLDPESYKDILMLIATRQKDKFFRRTFLPQDPPMVRQTTREAMMTVQQIIDAERRGQFPRTYEGSCKWCDYKDICIAELHGADPRPIIRMNYTTSRRDKTKPWQS